MMPTDKKAGDSALKKNKNVMTADSAIKAYYKDSAEKVKTYNRASRIIGAFDHSSMDSKELNKYCVKKLGLDCANGFEKIALDSYFNAIESAAKATKKMKQNSVAMDSVRSTSSSLDSYFGDK